MLALVLLTKGSHQHWGRKTWKSIPRHINTNKEDIKLSRIWKVPTPMSTWCAAKNLFLYYRKYLSEHICNMLLWEHILGILFMQHAQVDSRLDSGLRNVASLLCLLSPLPATHSFGKLVQPDLWVFSRCLYIWLWVFLCLSGFAERDRDFQHIGFPLLFPCSTQGKPFLFAKENLEPGEHYLRNLPAFSSFASPLSFWEPPALPYTTRHAGSIGRAFTLQMASRQLKLFQQSRSQRNTRGKWQFLTDTISCLQTGRQQCSSFISASNKMKWQGNVGPHRRNLKSKTFTLEQKQSFSVALLFSSQKWRTL